MMKPGRSFRTFLHSMRRGWVGGWGVTLLSPLALFGGDNPAGPELVSGATRLGFFADKAGGRGLVFRLGTNACRQDRPCAANLVTDRGTDRWVTAAYGAVVAKEAGVLEATGTVTGESGTRITFTDTWRIAGFGNFKVNRKVAVEQVGTGDVAFSTRFSLSRPEDESLETHEVFVPAIWYEKNEGARSNALGTHPGLDSYYFREDRMPLPLVMLRDPRTGATVSLFHAEADGATFTGEDGIGRIIDRRIQFAALGLERKGGPTLGLVFPGSEGERTGIGGMKNESRWALRAHPLDKGFTQNYAAVLRYYYEKSFPDAMAHTWKASYDFSRPALYDIDLAVAAQDQIDLLARYWRVTNDSCGFPFKVTLAGSVKDSDYNWNMGFVGKQTWNAALVLRAGFRSGDPRLTEIGTRTLDWWADHCTKPSGCPRTWYDPGPARWRRHTSLRVVGDGMQGLLYGWATMKANGVDRPRWLNTCTHVAAWLAGQQGADGSFPRTWDSSTSNDAVLGPEKNCTSHVVPFLVDLVKVTGDPATRRMALRAGEYCLREIHDVRRYVGGAIDNPNVMDKEATSMALRAFLALYDLTGDVRYQKAAAQAADYEATWVYSWSVPVPRDNPKAIYPAHRSCTGMSIIATGHSASDNYAALDAFSFYRLYLFSGDETRLHFARLLLQNTKQSVNSDRKDPLPGYGAWGLMGEATGFVIGRGQGVTNWLPWQSHNMLEPVALLEDTFGTPTCDLDKINALKDKAERHKAYGETRGLPSRKMDPLPVGKPCLILNRVSGSFLTAGADAGSLAWSRSQSNEAPGWVVETVGADRVKLSRLSNGKAIPGDTWQMKATGHGYYRLTRATDGQFLSTAEGPNGSEGEIAFTTDGSDTRGEWLLIPR